VSDKTPSQEFVELVFRTLLARIGPYILYTTKGEAEALWTNIGNKKQLCKLLDTISNDLKTGTLQRMQTRQGYYNDGV
jgi:hypothetical protein